MVNYEPILKHVIQQVQEQPEQTPDVQNRVDDVKVRWSDLHNKVIDQQQIIEDVVPAAITCEEAWEELEPHLNDVEARLKKITTIPVEHKGLTKQQNILKVSSSKKRRPLFLSRFVLYDSLFCNTLFISLFSVLIPPF